MREHFAVDAVKVWTKKFWEETDGMSEKKFVEEYLKSKGAGDPKDDSE